MRGTDQLIARPPKLTVEPFGMGENTGHRQLWSHHSVATHGSCLPDHSVLAADPHSLWIIVAFRLFILKCGPGRGSCGLEADVVLATVTLQGTGTRGLRLM